jgi:hypothetical protein
VELEHEKTWQVFRATNWNRPIGAQSYTITQPADIDVSYQYKIMANLICHRSRILRLVFPKQHAERISLKELCNFCNSQYCWSGKMEMRGTCGETRNAHKFMVTPWKHIELWYVEALTFSSQSTHWWGVRLPALRAGSPLPPGTFLVLICVKKLSRPQGRNSVGRIRLI